ncbi:hypothetical protein Salat_1459000 [Sesamum alatum]|uniref:Retrotransposon gag domain-containing protein n=1 Tax=Sesamum alatum TaxID=300844 RepID=A0AAE2CLT5_9LAMI|nr:hypothetical protein Salat_1459000 [Sesamum alatum]
MSELMNLKQTRTIQEFMDRFDELLNCLELPETYAVSCFLGGLKDEIALQVRMFKPKTMQEVISLARLQEQAFKLSSSSRNSSSLNNHKSFSHFSRPLAVTPPSKPPVPNPSTSYTSNRFTQIPPHRIANPNHKPILQSRRMSPQEMDEKRSKGLCYWCDDKYTPGHQCSKRKQIYIMEVLDEDESMLHKEVEDEEWQQQGMATEEDDCSNFHISVNAMTGVHNFNTMRVTGCCKGKAINILIDPGSTHNFVDFQVARRLGC